MMFFVINHLEYQGARGDPIKLARVQGLEHIKETHAERVKSANVSSIDSSYSFFKLYNYNYLNGAFVAEDIKETKEGFENKESAHENTPASWNR